MCYKRLGKMGKVGVFNLYHAMLNLYQVLIIQYCKLIYAKPCKRLSLGAFDMYRVCQKIKRTFKYMKSFISLFSGRIYNSRPTSDTGDP